MSQLPNGNNGYPNGDHRSNTANPYDQSYRNRAAAPDNQDRWPGGYGGFQSSGNAYPSNLGTEEHVPTSSDDHYGSANDGSRHAGPRFGDRSQAERYLGSRTIGPDAAQNASSLYGSGPGGRQIEGGCPMCTCSATQHTLFAWRNTRRSLYKTLYTSSRENLPWYDAD